jgi:hypothetical protein
VEGQGSERVVDVLAGAKVTAAVVAVVGHVCCVLCRVLRVEMKVAYSKYMRKGDGVKRVRVACG